MVRVALRLGKSAGSAFKLTSSRFFPNAFTYALLMFLSYLTLVDVGLIRDPNSPAKQPTVAPTAPTTPTDAKPIRHATDDWPERG